MITTKSVKLCVCQLICNGRAFRKEYNNRNQYQFPATLQRLSSSLPTSHIEKLVAVEDNEIALSIALKIKKKKS